MYKSFFLTILFFLSEKTIYAQDTINWSQSHKLEWKDFKAKPDSMSQYGAISAISIKYSFSVSSSVKFSVYCFFDRNESWARVHTEESLRHEQGHFDIGEIFARKIREALSNYHFDSTSYKKDVSRIYNGLIEQKNHTNKLYDTETDYHRNNAQQQKWNKMIAQELDRLKQFAK